MVQINRRELVAASGVATLLAVGVAGAADASDPDAMARIDTMFVRLGGREVWARVRGLYLEYRQDFAGGDTPSARAERGWRDLTEPNERLEWRWPDTPRRPGFTVGRGFDNGEVWIRNRNGEVRLADAAETADFLNFWPRDFYTMFVRLARRDPALVLRFEAPHRINVVDTEGTPQGWWEIGVGGDLMRWGATFNAEEELSYVYGPLRSYGDIAFPAWGASSDGTFRFEYDEVMVSDRALPRAVFANRRAPPPADLRL